MKFANFTCFESFNVSFGFYEGIISGTYVTHFGLWFSVYQVVD